jgi:hypothetical protein
MYQLSRDEYSIAANKLKKLTKEFKTTRDAFTSAIATYTESMYEAGGGAAGSTGNNNNKNGPGTEGKQNTHQEGSRGRSPESPGANSVSQPGKSPQNGEEVGSRGRSIETSTAKPASPPGTNKDTQHGPDARANNAAEPAKPASPPSTNKDQEGSRGQEGSSKESKEAESAKGGSMESETSLTPGLAPHWKAVLEKEVQNAPKVNALILRMFGVIYYVYGTTLRYISHVSKVIVISELQ